MNVARANQENAIYEQQTAAAAKPLNQGVKGLTSKTAANKAPKTPFKVPLNDENAAFGGGKTGGKSLFGEGKSGKADNKAFVTPAGPRNRAPLGNKTTNAKATAFQTPALLGSAKRSAKPTSPRLRRAKIKVHEAEPATDENEQEEREIEYMPPREVPLPDHPDDWPHDRTYPQFEGVNLTRGWWSEFSKKHDDDGGEDALSDFEEKLKQLESREEKAKQAEQAKMVPVSKTTGHATNGKQPQTLMARSAASALSRPNITTALAGPAAGKERLPSTVASKKATPNIAPGNVRHSAAKIASTTTLGYSKGRAISATARGPVSEMHDKHVPATDKGKASPDKKPTTSLQDLFDLNKLRLGDNADAGLGGGVASLDMEDEDLKDFQLDAVEI